jgi:Peptidase A4 family
MPIGTTNHPVNRICQAFAGKLRSLHDTSLVHPLNHEAGLARSSAEVITEAPSSSTGVLPLANFGTVNYAGAEANGTALASLSPTEIIMADSSGLDKDSTSAISGGAFSNTWLRST